MRLESQSATEALGGRLAGVLSTLDGSCMIYLRGDLGAGKTTLVRGLLRALGHEGPVKSPTYTLVESYEPGGWRVFHWDLYRLADPEELEYIGMRDFFDESSIVLVEWPQRGQGVLPAADLLIDLEFQSDGKQRLASIIPRSGRGQRIVDCLQS